MSCNVLRLPAGTAEEGPDMQSIKVEAYKQLLVADRQAMDLYMKDSGSLPDYCVLVNIQPGAQGKESSPCYLCSSSSSLRFINGSLHCPNWDMFCDRPNNFVLMVYAL